MSADPHGREMKHGRLPKIHAPGPNGGALCGAGRRRVVLTTDGHGLRPDETDCASCGAKLAKPPCLARIRKYHVSPTSGGPRMVVETSSPIEAVKSWVAAHGRCGLLVTQVLEYPRVMPMYWGVSDEFGVYRVGGNWACLSPGRSGP